MATFPRSRATAALLLLLTTAVTGCGGSDKQPTTKTVTVGATQPQTQTQTTDATPRVPIPPPTQTMTTATAPTPPASSGGSLSQAEAEVSTQGYNVDDPGAYHDGQALRVLVGTKKGSGDGYAKRAFFFAGGRYLGTDTSADSAGIRVGAQSAGQVTLEYAIYTKADALCCPSGTRSVRYRLNGSRLQPLDAIPPASERG
ncbi:MAG: hypothetical protein QOJ07_62 [Thermoleophilaceae bacterium]|nr:hypothetical protein [Thermoleophilaceae bacterium]